MTANRRPTTWLLGMALAVAAQAGHLAPAAVAGAFPDDDRAIVHVLNRIGFGPRPGDVEQVHALGLQRYIDQQLHPERIADAGMSARLAGLSTRRHELARHRPAVRAADARGAPRTQGCRSASARRRRSRQPTRRCRIRCSRRRTASSSSSPSRKMLRAVYSDRQLQEVLTDFWFNHFNVDARKGRDRFMLTEYERDAIRPHVLGKFRDLLGATAKSPAMLFYLDNWMSADPNGPHMPIAARQPAPCADRSAARPACRRRRRHAAAGDTNAPKGPERELRPRADGAAHARRRRRLHAEGRHRSRARVHRLDDREPAAGRRLPLRAAAARRRREGRARPRHQGRRRRSRTASRCSTSSRRIRRRRTSSRRSWRAAS